MRPSRPRCRDQGHGDGSSDPDWNWEIVHSWRRRPENSESYYRCPVCGAGRKSPPEHVFRAEIDLDFLPRLIFHDRETKWLAAPDCPGRAFGGDREQGVGAAIDDDRLAGKRS